MRITFIHLLNGVMPSYSHAIASLVASLSNHDVSFLSIKDENPNNVSRILGTNPALILMSVMSNHYKYANQLCKNLKEHSGSKIQVWIGGSHINAVPHDFYESNFDAACYGEGEVVLPEAITHYERGIQYDNSAWLSKDRNQTLHPAVIEDLDSLPLPRLDIFDLDDVLTYPSVMFSRGCPYGCTYCLSRHGGVGGHVRWKSVDRAIRETKDLVNYAKPKEVYFDDDTFLKNPKWVSAFLFRYKQEVGLPFYCNSRPEAVNARICELLVDSGCVALGIGIESGSEKIRKNVLNRNISDEEIINSFHLAKSKGLSTWSFNMIGIPGEQVDDLRATIRLNEMAGVDFVRVSVYTPYPGTVLSEGATICDFPSSYFDALNLLPEAMREKANDWVNALKQKGMLWNDDI